MTFSDGSGEYADVKVLSMKHRLQLSFEMLYNQTCRVTMDLLGAANATSARLPHGLTVDRGRHNEHD